MTPWGFRGDREGSHVVAEQKGSVTGGWVDHPDKIMSLHQTVGLVFNRRRQTSDPLRWTHQD